MLFWDLENGSEIDPIPLDGFNWRGRSWSSAIFALSKVEGHIPLVRFLESTYQEHVGSALAQTKAGHRDERPVALP